MPNKPNGPKESVPVRLDPEFNQALKRKLLDEGDLSFQGVCERLLREFVAGTRTLAEEIPPDVQLLKQLLDSPRDFFEELMRDDLLIKIEALKKWRENESRRASGRP